MVDAKEIELGNHVTPQDVKDAVLDKTKDMADQHGGPAALDAVRHERCSSVEDHISQNYDYKPNG